MEFKLQVLGERIHNALLEHTKLHDTFGINLAGACAVGSYLLVKEAERKYGLPVTFRTTSSHAWTEYNNEIYDITATQFGRKEKVFTVHRSRLDMLAGQYLSSVYSSTSNRDVDYVNRDWPDYQRPKNYQIKWLNNTKARLIRKGVA